MFEKLFKSKAKPVVLVGDKQWRKGMWVVYEGRVGILASFEPIEVHITDPVSGETTLVVNAPLGGLRQAKYDEIPRGRRGHLSAEAGKALGYGS